MNIPKEFKNLSQAEISSVNSACKRKVDPNLIKKISMKVNQILSKS